MFARPYSLEMKQIVKSEEHTIYNPTREATHTNVPAKTVPQGAGK